MKTIQNSPTPIYLFRIKAHAGIAGNECADAVAKYQAIQENDNHADTVLPCAGISGNPFYNTTWLAFENAIQPNANAPEPLQPSTPNLRHFSNLHNALKSHMHIKHKLGYADPRTGYYSYYKSLLPKVHKSISNAFWTMSAMSFKMKRNIFHHRTGTLFNQKHAVRFKKSTSLQCPLCQQTDSALHILSGCQHQTISGMITERHNTASRMIMKATKSGTLRGCFVQMDKGSKDRLALQDLQIPEGCTNRTIPDWLFPRRFPTKQRLTSSRPDAIIVTSSPTKPRKALPIHPRYALRSRVGGRGDGELSAPVSANQLPQKKKKKKKRLRQRG